MWPDKNGIRGKGAEQKARTGALFAFGLLLLGGGLGNICVTPVTATSTGASPRPALGHSKLVPLPVVRYVNNAVVTSGDGTSWAVAFKTIQEGIDAVALTGLGEVWVAQGIYNETRTSTPHGDGVNTGSVMMKPGVHLYGGFAGTETARDQRNWNVYSTVISGGKTRGGLDAYHVIVGAEPATLDGFIVTGGNASGSNDEGGGGGMFNSGVSPVIQNCIFRGNQGLSNGGMTNANGASPTITGCVFNSNSASVNAGGIGNWGASTVTIRDCSFIANGSGRMGGGLFDGNAAATTIVNCLFKDNSAVNVGGGIADYSNGLSKVINCVFINNTLSGTTWGGGGIGSWQSSPTVTNCSFTLNSGAGAAIYSDTDKTVVTNCILWNDTGGEVKGSPVITYSDVKGGHSGTGNINADPLFADPAKDNLQLQWGSPCADAGTVTGAPTSDFTGAARPCGKGVDMGAYELAIATLRGVVKDSVTDAGLGCAAIAVMTAGVPAGHITSADLNGRYCVADLPPGVYQVKVYAPGYASEAKSITLGAGVTGWSFSLKSSTLSGGVRGTCTDRDHGQPLAGIRVDAYIKGVLKGTTYTGACGRYDINHLVGLTAKGTTDVTLEFSSDGYTTQDSDVSVPSGGSAESSPSLSPKFAVPGAVAGVITNSQSGLPIGGARVTTEGVVSVSADTDGQGVYALTVLPEGTYTLIASAIGYQSKSCVQSVSSVTEVVDFVLLPNSQAPLEDLNSDSVVDAVDVQLVINAALSIATGLDCDVNCDNSVDAVDVQKVINCALGVS